MTKKLVRDYGLTVAAAIVAAVLIRSFGVEAYRIPSDTMRPALLSGDTIFVAKWPFGLRFGSSTQPLTRPRLPVRGEVIVYTAPNPAGVGELEFIKRVVALPGESVELKSGKLLVNGRAVTSAGETACVPEALSPSLTYTVCREPPLLEDQPQITIPQGQVFVLGDLRARSPLDTRRHKTWGLVPLASIRGSALWIWLSIEPKNQFGNTGWFPQFRFDRMFRRIS